MSPPLTHNKDFWAGMVLISIGAVAMFVAREYPFGSSQHMGPGFFPLILAGLLIVLGVCILALSFGSADNVQGPFAFRPLLLLPLSLVLFGVLMDHAGVVPAILVLVFTSAAADRGSRTVEVLFLALGLTAVSVAVFVWGLGLPYPLLNGF